MLFRSAISTALPLISDRLTNLELILDPTYLSPFLANTASYTSLVDLSVVYESNDLWDLEAEFDSDAAELEHLSSPHMSNLEPYHGAEQARLARSRHLEPRGVGAPDATSYARGAGVSEPFQARHFARSCGAEQERRI